MSFEISVLVLVAVLMWGVMLAIVWLDPNGS